MRSDDNRLRADSRATLALAVTLLALGCATSVEAPRAVAGRLDLSGWDFSAGNAALEGEWAVCWGQLLEPGADCPSGWKTVHVRGLWSDVSARSPFGGRGVATYRLTIDWPADPPRLVLRAGASLSSHRVWIDGVEHEGSGVVGSDAATTSSVPRRNRTFELPEGAAQTELWVQVANFDEFRGGGLRRPWLVGTEEAIHTWSDRALLREATFSAIALLVGAAYLLQFALRPRERARGYLGLFALVLGLRAIPSSISGFSEILLPWASFAQLTRFEYLGTALVIFAGAGYFRIKVPGVTPPRTMWGFQLVALALAAIVLAAPYPLVLETLPLFLVLPPAVLALVLVCYGRAWWRGVPGVGVTLAASGVFLVGVVHDVLRTSLTDFGFDIELFPYFLLVWLVAEAVELGQIFFRTFERVESLSEELAEANFELQETEAAIVRFVPFDFLRVLGKHSIREIRAGDHASARMSVLDCQLGPIAGDAARMDGEETLRFMNELIARLEPRIARHDGFVSSYRRDGLQALFPGRAEDALAAAIEIRDAVQEFEGDGAAFGRTTFEVGIGIDTGLLLLGTIGDQQRLSSVAVGDAVAAAPRIAALARSRDAGLLISAATRDALRSPSIDGFREVGAVSLESGAEPVELFEVVEGVG